MTSQYNEPWLFEEQPCFEKGDMIRYTGSNGVYRGIQNGATRRVLACWVSKGVHYVRLNNNHSPVGHSTYLAAPWRLVPGIRNLTTQHAEYRKAMDLVAAQPPVKGPSVMLHIALQIFEGELISDIKDNIESKGLYADGPPSVRGMIIDTEIKSLKNKIEERVRRDIANGNIAGSWLILSGNTIGRPCPSVSYTGL